jgi:hypothetical protein
MHISSLRHAHRPSPCWLRTPESPGMSSFSLLATNAARSLDPTGSTESTRLATPPPGESQSSFAAGAPRWVDLPGTVAGGAWMLPLTGTTGTTVLAPIAPGAPRVQKLAPGSDVVLTPSEVAAVIEEYKRARKMAKKHGGGPPAKPAAGNVIKPTDVAAARAAASAAVHAPLPEAALGACGGGGSVGTHADDRVNPHPHSTTPPLLARTPAAEAACQAAAAALWKTAQRAPGDGAEAPVGLASSGPRIQSPVQPLPPPLPPGLPLQVRVQPPSDNTAAPEPQKESPTLGGVPLRNPYGLGGSPTALGAPGVAVVPQAGVPSLRCTRPPPGFETPGGTPRTSPKEFSPTAGSPGSGRGPPPGFPTTGFPSIQAGGGPLVAECRPQQQQQQQPQVGGQWSSHSSDVFSGVQ